MEAQAALYSGGGTEADPYIIDTAAEMNDIGNNPNDFDSYFLLTADIDLGGYTGTSFNIIGPDTNDSTFGFQGTPFTGVFDGNGHTISNFTYNSTGTSYIGLFGYINDPNAEIKDLGLVDPNVDAGTGGDVGSLVGRLDNGTVTDCNSVRGSVSGNNTVGGLVGYNYNGTVSSSYATGNVSGDDCVGGLVGGNSGTMSNCYATASVSGTSNIVGGLVGLNYDTVSNSYATGSVSGNYVGGLVGWNVYGTVSNSYSTASVSGYWLIGGLVGDNVNGTMSNSYATGSVSGYQYVGGLVGRNYPGTVSNSYSVGDVNGVMDVGGLVGYDDTGDYIKSFWDNTVNPGLNGIGNITDPNVIAETTTNMQTASTFTDAGWDFVDEIDNGVQNIWRLCNEGTEYPQLNWQFLLGDFGCPDGVEISDLAVLIEQWLLEKLSADVAPDGGDGFVDFLDWAVLADGWQSTTDIDDLAVFIEQWLQFSAYSADIAPDGGDGIVNLPDFAALADNWLME